MLQSASLYLLHRTSTAFGELRVCTHHVHKQGEPHQATNILIPSLCPSFPHPWALVAFTMLAHSTRLFRPIATVARANKSRVVVQHLFRRELSGFIVLRANASAIRILETWIKEINANPSHSAAYRYRASVRLFAMIDLAKKCVELKALHDANATPLQQTLHRYLKDETATTLRKSEVARLERFFCEARLARRELARLRWSVFRLTVFAPWGDVSVAERLIRIPLFLAQSLIGTILRSFIFFGVAILKQIKEEG